MTRDELIAAIDDLRNELAEARRYVRSKPAETTVAVERFRARMIELRSAQWLVENCAGRLICNLQWGLEGIRCCPVAIEGAIDLASFELAWIKGRLEASPGTVMGRAGG
jgi:hypothetical protein